MFTARYELGLKLSSLLFVFKGLILVSFSRKDSELVRYGGPVLSNRLLQLINKCWRERLIPEEWGQATVKSLFKKR